jgi:hypothetical protein
MFDLLALDVKSENWKSLTVWLRDCRTVGDGWTRLRDAGPRVPSLAPVLSASHGQSRASSTATLTSAGT